jgi:hypothetical protein
MQGVLVFASSAARAAAITSPQEGQYSYLKDTNSTEYYDGAAWIAAPIGDITGVTAGTGISGGGTSGTVTITNSMATEITAAGDIIVGTGSGTFDNLPIGTTNQVLTADTTVSPYKVKWATPAGGGGKVLQVVNATYGTAAQVSSATWTDTGLTATITPTSATSKVLVIANINGIGKSPDVAPGVGLRVVRGATSIIQFEELAGYFAANPYATDVGGSGTSYLDSPATTSATTYKVQFNNYGGATGQAKINRAGGGTTSSITLLEIGA